MLINFRHQEKVENYIFSNVILFFQLWFSIFSRRFWFWMKEIAILMVHIKHSRNSLQVCKYIRVEVPKFQDLIVIVSEAGFHVYTEIKLISCYFKWLLNRRSIGHWVTPGQRSNTWKKVNTKMANTKLIGECFTKIYAQRWKIQKLPLSGWTCKLCPNFFFFKRGPFSNW